MKHQPQLGGIASALANQGRHGDDTLIHVSRKELEQLQKYSDELGIHLTTNPQTGLPEAFNWGGMMGSVGLPLLLTVASGGTLGPLALAAAGAAGGFGGTLMGGGKMDQALMSGVMGGIGGYGLGGIGEGLAAAGTAATEQAATQAVEQSAAQGITQGAEQSTLQTLGQTGAQQATQAMSQMPGLAAQNTGAALAEGMTPAAGSVVGGSFVPTPAAAPVLQSTPMTGTQLMGKGFDAITSSPGALGTFAKGQMGNIGMAGIGALGAGSTVTPASGTIQQDTSTSNPFKGEMYQDPETGQWRSRAVRRAAGGDVFSDYDAADAEKDGGYAPGGYLNFAAGGSSEAKASYTSGKGRPSVENPDVKFPDWWLEGEELGPDDRRRDGFAGGGGIGDLGGYSDGGRLLRGPGDGVSDSIPASIENKRPARLADGEFVIPARAVSELGNGSTEAGSKQLYSMLDRIAAKRKTGKNLAYQANPRKLMPV